MKTYSLFPNEYIQNTTANLISKGVIPLEKGMMKRLGFSEEGVEAYHATNIVNLENLIKIQGKDNHLSCFTKGGSELAKLPSQPNILLKLKGTSVLAGETDLWTLVSYRNKRWLNISKEKFPKLFFYIEEIMKKLIFEFNLDKDNLEKSILKLSNKEQVKIYRFYLSNIEKMLDKHYKELINYIKNASDMSYNEIVLTKWNIEEAKLIEIQSPAFVSLIKEANLKYTGVIKRKYLSKLTI